MPGTSQASQPSARLRAAGRSVRAKRMGGDGWPEAAGDAGAIGGHRIRNGWLSRVAEYQRCPVFLPLQKALKKLRLSGLAQTL